MVVLDRFQNELAELVFPKDTLLFPLHQSADYFQGPNAVIEDAFRGILVLVLANHLPEIICFLVEGVTEGGLELLFVPGKGVDTGEQVDSVLGSVRQIAAGLLNQL